jgi:hypothetical protein
MADNANVEPSSKRQKVLHHVNESSEQAEKPQGNDAVAAVPDKRRGVAPIKAE